MRIVGIGTGGIGGYLGGWLARAGKMAAFVARREPRAAILARGLAVRSLSGDFMVEAPATDDPRRVPDLIGPVDLVLESAALRAERAA